eukprot:TRINITY_DN5412_c0_g1_i1.p1 TRINITY_DN5412_c0_g1~~TRINITY_DN5412_c0_g1_i1.p1  ORF type:complete len:131 (+),score=20.14 TRINITY_DN5412_c0_g1_i1:66-458(+)
MAKDPRIAATIEMIVFALISSALTTTVLSGILIKIVQAYIDEGWFWNIISVGCVLVFAIPFILPPFVLMLIPSLAYEDDRRKMIAIPCFICDSVAVICSIWLPKVLSVLIGLISGILPFYMLYKQIKPKL